MWNKTDSVTLVMGVALDKQLGIILYLLHNPASHPLPGDILEKLVCEHRRRGQRTSILAGLIPSLSPHAALGHLIHSPAFPCVC